MNSTEILAESLEDLEKEVWHLAKVEIPALQEQIDNLNSSSTTDLETQINKNASDITSLTTRLSELEANSGSSEHLITIYEASNADEAIHMNLKTGFRPTNSINHNFNQYKKLRFYFKSMLKKSIAVFEYEIINNELKLFFSMPLSVSGFSIYELEFTSTMRQTLSFVTSAYYEFVGNAGETMQVTKTESLSNVYGLILRIEGIK